MRNLDLAPKPGYRVFASNHSSKPWGGRRTPCGGRPKWQPSSQQLANVEQAARAGLSQDAIAALFNISESTLKRHCAQELRLGYLYCRAQVALVAFEMACSGKHPAMTRLWLRTRMGWK